MNNQSNPLLRTAIRLAAGAPLMIGLPTFAGEASSASRMEEIVVTATRRDANVQEIPYNLSAISGDAMERLGISDIGSLMRKIPGVAYVDSGPRGGAMNNTIFIRGINANAQVGAITSPVGSVAPVSTYIGDTPIFTNLHLTDIDRVEVLRGPQGTLYGSGSLGGTVRFLFNKPDMQNTSIKFDGGVSSTRGSGDLAWETGLVANVPLSDSVAVRASVGRIERAGFLDAVGLHRLDAAGVPVLADPADVVNSPPVFYSRKDVNESETSYARVTLAADLGDRISANLSYHYQGDEALLTQGENPNAGRLQTTLVNLEPYDRDVHLGALEIEADLGFATLASSTSRFDDDSQGFRDATGGYVNAGFWSFYEGSPRENILGQVTTAESKFVQELRLTSTTGGTIDWIAGAYYADEKIELVSVDRIPGWSAWHEACGYCVQGFPTANQPDDLNYTFDRTFEVRDLAMFGEVTFHLGEHWQVTGGFRAFEIKVDNILDQSLPMCGSFCSTDGVDPVGRSGDTISRTFRDQIFRFNTSYDIGNGHLAYFNFAEGFRRGGGNAVPTTGVFGEDPLFLSYEPDQTTNYEVGLKGELFDTLRYSTSVFYIDWKDVQIDTSTPNGGFAAIVNGDKARSRGVELEFQGTLASSLLYAVSYSYIDAKLASDFTAGAILGFDGDRLPLTPKHLASLALEYFVTPPFLANYEMGFHLSGYYRGQALGALNTTNPDYAELDGFSMWDAAVSLSGDQFTARLFVNNLADERGVTGIRSINRVGLDGAYDLIARPRTAGISVSYRFE